MFIFLQDFLAYVLHYGTAGAMGYSKPFPQLAVTLAVCVKEDDGAFYLREAVLDYPLHGCNPFILHAENGRVKGVVLTDFLVVTDDAFFLHVYLGMLSPSSGRSMPSMGRQISRCLRYL